MELQSATPWPWTVVLPVKGGPAAKSRLSALGTRRAALAAAVAHDTLATVGATSRVARMVVVTADPRMAGFAAGLGAAVVPDAGKGLDAAVTAGLRTAPAQRPCAVLLADLPAMRPSDLAEGLDACTAELLAGAVRAVVPDAAGDGTVLMAATHPAALHPSYGPGSGTRHAVGGVLLDLPNERLRRDVDTPDDLAVVAELGVGPATAAALRTDIHGVV